MNMTLGELIGILTEMQKVAPDGTQTNVEAVRLKGLTSLSFANEYGYSSYQRDAKRVKELSIWLEGYPDAPQPPASCASGGLNAD